MYEDLMYELVDASFEVKEEYLLERAKDGDMDAAYLLAKLYFESDYEPGNAFEWFLTAAESDHPDATYYLGNFYNHPSGFDVVEPSEENAISYWSKAVELGSPLGMDELGWRYMQDGWGVEKDEAKGRELLEKASDLGYHKSLSRLSNCYKNGIGVEKSVKKALEYAEKAYEALLEEIIC